jgi:hypothetical protein
MAVPALTITASRELTVFNTARLDLMSAPSHAMLAR